MSKKKKSSSKPDRRGKGLSAAAMEEKREKPAKKERISPREATLAAMRYYNELTNRSQRATIEEIELNEAQGRWLVTLALEDEIAGLTGFGSKAYKIFEVDAHTGNVLSMKIRQL